MDNENKKPKHICTECLFIGEPRISVGRLFVEFILNLLIDGGGAPLFQKVRHCPECGSHSMVAVSSESGQIAMEKLKNTEKEQLLEARQEQGKASGGSELEYTRIRTLR